jgi:hypothetical protein
LITLVKPGLVELHEGQIAAVIGGCGVGTVEAFEGGAFGGVQHLVAEGAGFDGPGAALAPEDGDEFLDERELDGVGGLEAFDVLLHEPLEEADGLGGQEKAGREAAAAERGAGRAALRFRG